MRNIENLYDKTIWDPINPEHAVEDLLHGSEAIIRLLETPPMPLDNGNFHVFGALSFVRTCTFDNYGKPYIEFRTPDTMDTINETRRIFDWFKLIDSDSIPDIKYPEFDFTATPYLILED